jgi:hypothetical protein
MVVLNTINLIPSVNFTNSDPFGAGSNLPSAASFRHILTIRPPAQLIAAIARFSPSQQID